MCDSLPSPRYSPVCNVLRQWKTSLIPTYRVYRLYDIYTAAHAEFIIMIMIISWVWPSVCPHFGGKFVWNAASRDFVSVHCPEQRDTEVVASRRLNLY